jgi:2'-5' RNA ligase
MRAFLAIDLPNPVKADLSAAQSRIESRAPGFYRWVGEEQMHLTLYFLGEMDESSLSQVEQACASIAQPTLQIKVGGLVLLPEPNVPRIIATGVGGETDALTKFQQRLSDTVFPLAEFKETRRFYPHITLGRLKRGMPGNAKMLKRTLAETKIGQSEPFKVEEFLLMSSQRSEEGSHYETLHRFPLA